MRPLRCINNVNKTPETFAKLDADKWKRENYGRCDHATARRGVGLSWNSTTPTSTPTPTRTTSRGSSPTRPTRAISWSYSCGKLNNTPSFSLRSSRGCRCRCPYRRRAMPALLHCARVPFGDARCNAYAAGVCELLYAFTYWDLLTSYELNAPRPAACTTSVLVDLCSISAYLKFCALLGPFYGAIVVPSVTRCRCCCRCCRGHRCASGVRQWRRATVATPGEWQCKTARSGEWAQHFFKCLRMIAMYTIQPRCPCSLNCAAAGQQLLTWPAGHNRAYIASFMTSQRAINAQLWPSCHDF